MNREAFAHVIRAAADVVKDEIVIVGSQAVLGSHVDPPPALVRSLEVDVYPRSDPDRAHEIDGALGDGSQFHATYGYYAHGVGPETIVAPSGWEDRLVRLEFPAIRRADAPVIGWCLSFDDLVLAKLAAGREHDLAFVEAAVREGMVDNDQFSLGLELMPEGYREDVQTRMQHIRACVGGLSG